ncbi:MAG: hypothetical protein IPK32_23230 [Verrucomicrobiaceae bacterium]|nr:hypothetical protein [Verrucomicrobiaceae bacterium]
MAQAFLKALGLDGEIGTITIDLQGPTTTTAGHEVKKGTGGAVTLASTKWPFCFDGDKKDANGTRSILPFTAFNEELNRLTLKVTHMTAAKAKVAWGTETKEFTREQLEAGVNLTAAFEKTPFDRPFADLVAAIGQKQAFETLLIKSLVTHMRIIAAEAAAEPKLAAALEKLKQKLASEHAKQDANVRRMLRPVDHSFVITELK